MNTNDSREGAKPRSGKGNVEEISAIGKQVLTCLRLLRLPVGLLINFGAATFKEGMKRIVNDHKNFASSRLRVNQTQ